MMHYTQLGYIGITASDSGAWRAFAGEYLGMQLVDDNDGGLALRMDERWHRILIEPAQNDGLAFLGLETAGPEQLEAAATRLQAQGLKVERGNPEECSQRNVQDMFWLRDPDGYRVEFYCNPAVADEPFIPARPIGGFRAGALGFGHLVLQTCNFGEMEEFYLQTIGLRLSDYTDGSPFRASFMHVNPRHHSLALIEFERPGIHHIMIEYNFIDDVGRLYDMALKNPESIAVTLGRHANDHVLSFYTFSPGGFMIETGWAGRLIDVDRWEPELIFGPSIWGHERHWLPPERRAAAQAILETAAEKGIMEPTSVTRSPAFKIEES